MQFGGCPFTMGPMTYASTDRRRFAARMRWLLVLASVVVVAPSAVFAAATEPATPVALNTDADTSFSISPVWVVLISSVVIPIINGLVTKLSDSSKLKAVITLALSGVAGLITVGVTDDGGAVISTEALLAAAITFVISVSTYNGLYKPLGLTSSAKSDGTPGALAGVGRK